MDSVRSQAMLTFATVLAAALPAFPASRRSRFALRLGHYLDQRFMATALPDAARGMLASLPSMRTQEAIVFGEGVRLPMHIRFDDLPPERRPRSDSAQFSKAWQSETAGAEFLDEGIQRWRQQTRKPATR